MKLGIPNAVASIIDEKIDNLEVQYTDGTKIMAVKSPELDKSCGSLQIDQYADWFTIITENDHLAVESKLSNTSGVLKDALLNGTFEYLCEPELLKKTRADGRPSFQVTRPWCLAGAYSARETLKVLYNHNVDVLAQDTNGKVYTYDRPHL